MSKSRTRTKKCSERDITEMLDSGSDNELLFKNLQRHKVNVVGSLPGKCNNAESTYASAEEIPKRATRSCRSRSKDIVFERTPGSSNLSQEDEDEEKPVSLRIKLRRSTEQSDYKVQTIFDSDERTRRSSRRSNVGTPKKCALGDYGEDNSARKKMRETSKTPISSTVSRGNRARRMSAIVEKNIGIVNEMKSTRPRVVCYGPSDYERDAFDSEERLRRRKRATSRESPGIRIETSQKSWNKLEEAMTPRSLRAKRNSRLINYNEISYDEIDNTLDKENKSENDLEEDSDSLNSRGRTRQRLTRSVAGTPRKEIKILEEPSTPKRTPRKSACTDLQQTTPNRKTPRRSTMTKIREEPDAPTTPRGTPGGGRISRLVDTPSMRKGNLTPSMSRRTANIGKPITILEEARAKLHVSAIPKSLPCREEEFNDIYQFLERKLLDNNGGCIYISGVPGTGKTATVNEVIRCLKKLVVKGDLGNFDFVEINGMKLSEPRQAYVQVLKQINGQTATWEQAYQILNTRFTQSSGKRPMTLLLVDELDLLCNKRQDVVYNLLDWPAKRNSRLVVITIANTMDLPERVLMGRVTSRLGLTRLTFQPYNHKQLQEIVMTRLRDSDAFKSEAVQLVARKVAAVSGDARRALDICRRATEVAELNDGKIVTVKDVNQALSEMIASAKVRAIKYCSEMEKIFLQAVCAEVARTGVEETNFYNVYRQLESLCSLEGLNIPNVTQALGICGRLGANRLLLCEHSRNDTQQRILLNVSTDDIHFAMQDLNIA